jgi:hypothetical protein
MDRREFIAKTAAGLAMASTVGVLAAARPKPVATTYFMSDTAWYIKAEDEHGLKYFHRVPDPALTQMIAAMNREFDRVSALHPIDWKPLYGSAG